jgi:hypothetical protein
MTALFHGFMRFVSRVTEKPSNERLQPRVSNARVAATDAKPSARNVATDQALAQPMQSAIRRIAGRREELMTMKEHDRIVETATEARQAEPGPSIFMLLTVSTGLAVMILGLVWFIFFY